MAEAIRRNRTREERRRSNETTQQRQTGRTLTSGGKDIVSAESPPAGPASNLGPSGLPLLRTSERSTFKRCRWKWYQEFHDTVKPAVDVPPLRFGTLIHASLAAYYKPGIRRGPHPTETFERLYELDLHTQAPPGNMVEEIDAKWAPHRDLGIAMLDRYIAKYGKDDEWKVLVTEFPFRTIVHHPRDGVTPWFWYVGILDGIWWNLRTKRKVIVDHKTTVAIQLAYLAMDQQATAYWTWGVEALMLEGLLAPDGSEKIDGFLFNFLRKAKADARSANKEGYYLNKDGSISKKQPAPYHARVPIWRDWTEREKAKQMVIEEFKDIEAVRRGVIAPYKNPSQFTCTGCWALDICELHEIGQDWQEMRAMTTRTWQPYSEHEIREGR